MKILTLDVSEAFPSFLPFPTYLELKERVVEDEGGEILGLLL